MDRRIREIEQSSDPLNAPDYHPHLSRFGGDAAHGTFDQFLTCA